MNTSNSNKLRWTENEIDILKTENLKGTNYSEISMILGNRSMYACQGKGILLGLKGDRNVDEHFFDKDSDIMYYILGYWYADGGLYKKQGGHYFDIASIDKDQIEKIKNEMSIKTSILVDKTNKNHSYRIMVGNKRLVNNLINRFGLMYNKTAVLTIDKDLIPDKYFYDFLRGYFDGDGNIVKSNYLKKNGTKAITGLRFTGSKNIIFSLEKILTGMGYQSHLYEDKRNDKHNCWYLQYMGEHSKRMFENIYDNPVMCLDRKYDDYKQHVI